MSADVEGVVSFLRRQDSVDAVCKKYGIPKDQYTARPAGGLRASSRPPPGAVYVCSQALEAGMRVPLHGFFSETLAHFGIAPTQLAPNGWRIIVLCHYAGVPPSLAVFRHFFLLRIVEKKGGWYCFSSKNTSSLRFAGLPDSIKGWKHSFFLLSSPAPWPCPVEWGQPSKSSFVEPVLTGEEKRSAATLLRAHGAAPVDIRTYLRDSSLTAAKISLASPAPTPTPPPQGPSSCTRTSAGSKVMYPSVYDMLKNSRAEKAGAAQASPSANKVKGEPGNDATGSSPLCGKKRSLDEAAGKEGACRPPYVAVSTPPPARTSTTGSKGMSSSVYDMMKNIQAEKAAAALASASANKVKSKPAASDATGSSPVCGKKRRLDDADGNEGEGRPPLVANTPPSAHGCSLPAAEEPSDGATSSIMGILKAANNMIALLEKQLEQAKDEVTAVKAELAASERAAAAEREKAKVELAAAKRTGEAELGKVKAELAAAKLAAKADRESADAERAAVQQLLAGFELLKATTGAARRT
uniref:Uncharacterized protein n=1 Tax=Avena sativa TaxID=4498 RepID=A0ACD5Y133_AVESA